MLHYKVYAYGDLPWVTFIHDAGGSSNIWFKQLRAFKEKYNILLIDLRGHGLSKNLYAEWKNYSFEAIGKQNRTTKLVCLSD